MGKKLARKILTLIEKTLGVLIFIVPKNYPLRLSAAKSKFGFWYAGNVCDPSDIAYGIYRNGEVEHHETTLVKSILNELQATKSQVVVYDIGANSGYYSILSAHQGKGAISVYAFEPLREYTDLIHESIALNNLQKEVTVFETALGAEATTADIEIAGTGSSLTPGFLGSGQNPTRKISITSLDKIILKNNLLPPDFIKIDVEGYELEVLKGAVNTMEHCKPVLFVEIATELRNQTGVFHNKDAKNIFDLMSNLGYNAFVVTDTAIMSTQSALTSSGVYMYLFLHKDAPHNKLISQILTQ